MNANDEIMPSLMRYLDNEMTETERSAFQNQLSSNPDLRTQFDTFRDLSHLVVQSHPEQKLPNADFFQHQLMERIAKEETPKEVAPATGLVASLLAFFRNPFATAFVGAAACFLVMFPLTKQTQTPSQGNSSYVPVTDGYVKSFYHQDAHATVVVIEGIPEIPDDSDIDGFKFHVPGSLRNKLPGGEGVSQVNSEESIPVVRHESKDVQPLPIVLHQNSEP